MDDGSIAYFSMEIALDEGMPTYSGGLGVLAGTTEKETVLVAWGFLEDGSRELISVSLGNRESRSAWKGFLDDLE